MGYKNRLDFYTPCWLGSVRSWLPSTELGLWAVNAFLKSVKSYPVMGSVETDAAVKANVFPDSSCQEIACLERTLGGLWRTVTKIRQR